MKKRIFLGLTLSAIILSCSSNENTNKVTEVELIEEIIKTEKTEEESTEVVFMGVEKGEFTLYGHTDFDASMSTSIDAMVTEFEESSKFEGAVDITINEVCKNAGCWVNFAKTDSEETIMVFFRDHFTIPIEESNGKEAILYGSLISDTLSVDFQKHLLDDATASGEEILQEEYDAITEDKIDISFDCESILIKD
jgi:hypothetical protein